MTMGTACDHAFPMRSIVRRPHSSPPPPASCASALRFYRERMAANTQRLHNQGQTLDNARRLVAEMDDFAYVQAWTLPARTERRVEGDSSIPPPSSTAVQCPSITHHLWRRAPSKLDGHGSDRM